MKTIYPGYASDVMDHFQPKVHLMAGQDVWRRAWLHWLGYGSGSVLVLDKGMDYTELSWPVNDRTIVVEWRPFCSERQFTGLAYVLFDDNAELVTGEYEGGFFCEKHPRLRMTQRENAA